MSDKSDKTRTWMGKILFGVFGLGIMSLGLFGIQQVAQAKDIESIYATGEASAAAATGGCVIAGPSPSVCPPAGIKASLETVGEKIVAPSFRIALIQALLNLSQFVLNRLAYEAAVAIASGGPGETSLFYEKTPSEAFKTLGLDVAGEAVGLLSDLSSDELGVQFNLCAPSSPAVNLALAIGIKQTYQPTEPKCDILEVGKNWDSLIQNARQTITDQGQRQDAILSKFAESLQPGKNELSATLRINIAIDEKVHEQKLTQFLEQVNSTGYKSVVDVVTGNVETPAATLQNKFENQLEKVDGDESKIKVGELVNAGELIGGLALSTASSFTNVLLSQLLDRVYTGLFDSEPSADPFNLEAVGGTDRQSAQERFASIISTNPISTAEYNALSEFVVCTAEGVTNRSLYNCVMDVNFLAAVSRGNTGTAITIQEAIDEGLLHGDWPLISPENEAANQDPFCYTYGYCYGNVVKLRKARVLPIGWELAALRNSESNPATLQEIIDGFNDCTQEGTIGPANASNSDNKWCHLIDPNWVLKYPETQCRAVANGEIRLSTLSPGRVSVCVDAPSCIGEDNEGNCVDGYGYCVQEKNVWRFRGNECPEEYASCLSFRNTETGETGSFLANTVDYSVCDQDNAGCRWYRADKYYNDGGTADDPSDDTYEWLPEGDSYLTAERDDDVNYQTTGGAVAARTSYSYTSDSGQTYSYATYTHEDRLYLTNEAVACSSSDAGCTELYPFDQLTYLNAIRNASFENDTDSDGIPDGWGLRAGTIELVNSTSQYGSNAVAISSGSSMQLEQFVDVAAQNFYTFSGYFKADVAGATGTIRLTLVDEDGSVIDATGTSFNGDCTWSSSGLYYQINTSPSVSAFDRTECTFTVPADTEQVRVRVGNLSSSTIYADAVQLELGEDGNVFVEGYSATPFALNYKIAPDYLGCTGAETDPVECDQYAQVCQAQDVGCSLYSPTDGDPSVPAIISEIDQCPSECVGYTTYKQEATAYDGAEFPLYFIADQASVCSEQYVGCDAYTNLSTLEAGGEQVDYYTDLRFCLSPTIADGATSATISATYFTWEGSDNEGYQLQTWTLLQSNYSGSKDTFDVSGFEEVSPGLAPCTHIQTTSEEEVVCRDSNARMDEDVWNNEACDEHDDIFNNPDCREFFDTAGNIHYREYSSTISISDACVPYRKDQSEQTDCEASGGYWGEQGFCRYYVLPEESTQCPAEQNGCRAYTGGSGRNATTIINETFEAGTYQDFARFNGTGSDVSVSISNESVATEGHSLFVGVSGSASTYRGVESVQIYLDDTSTSEVYRSADSTTCTSNGGTVVEAGCEVTDGDETCTIFDGEASCGALTNSIVPGKTFVLDFWAKGSGDLFVSLEEKGGAGATYDFVNPTASIGAISDLSPVTLDGSWKLYSLGPIDTSDYTNFDENAILRFVSTGGVDFYLDNIVFKQVEENITLIKDSWVVPSSCDQAPSGASSPQYYLGCEAYTDQNGNDVELYQFSDLCSEEVVACEGFYHTKNSASPYSQVFNARCVYSTDTDVSDEEFVSTNTVCEVNGTEFCTISVGQSYCTFDVDRQFEQPLPIDSPTAGTYFGVVYGPETVVVEGDTPVYLVADDRFECSPSAVGCEEFGRPTFNQDQSEVEGFESVYYINSPEDYTNILCDHEALFCEEWSSSEDGNFYFKHPLEKTCEYRDRVTIDNRSYSGWFKQGTSEPCYWEDKNADGEYVVSEDEAYLISGENFGVWRNGDEDDGDDDTWDFYDGWVASCEDTYDLCTEFVDVVDNGGGLKSGGQSYYFTNDELLSEESLNDSQRCNGQVSQKFGCALFQNTTISELFYNTSASYVSSVHADILYGLEANSLVDPVSCSTDEGGVFTVSESDADLLDLPTRSVDLCAQRCVYDVDSGDQITSALAQQVSDVDTAFFERSCLFDQDCPVLTTELGDERTGTCSDISTALADVGSTDSADVYYLVDDSNEVLKVNRDRSCAAWLACESSRTSWNTTTNKYDTICDSINLCVEGKQQGDRSVCSQWDESEAEILSAYKYSARDVNWTGYEYSGNAIPNQLPVETYDQFDIAAQSVCVDNTGKELSSETGDSLLPMACNSFEDCGVDSAKTCTQDSQCTSANYGACDDATGTCFYACENQTEADYRLVYNAGSCDYTEDGNGNGGACTVGHCSETGVSCVDSDECSDGEECVIGYLQATGSVDCVKEDCSCNPNENDAGSNPSCIGVSSDSGVTTPICDPTQFVCVDELATDVVNRDPCVEDSATRTCVPSSTSTVGSCFNNRCLSDIVDENGDSEADRLVAADARAQACRAYPEVDSPFPEDVVSGWLTYTGTGIEADGESPSSVSTEIDEAPVASQSLPYTFVNGFQDANVCGLDEDGNFVDCLCSYDKAEYGSGTGYRYYEPGTGIESVPQGVCAGGPVAGIPCQDDDDCSTGEQFGSCSFVSRVDTVYGWNGYCIERDTSIQTLGSSAQEDQACLTWLPVDQLTGATDLYAKYATAGYAPQNTYFCADTELGFTVQTSDIGCAEVQDGNCDGDGMDWTDFRNESDNSKSAQDDCLAGIWCPDGYFAVMTGCGDLDEASYCSESGGDKDCPYFCVPKLSYKTQADGGGVEGEFCLAPGNLDGYDFDAPPFYEDSKGDVQDSIDAGAPANYYIDLGDLASDDRDVSDHWGGANKPNIRVFVVQWDDFANLRTYYDDCAVRGVVDNIDEYTYSDVFGALDVDELPSSREVSCGLGQCGFYGLSHQITPAAMCTSVVQVSSKSLTDEDHSIFKSYNATWTNRVWEGQVDLDTPYALTGSNPDDLGYRYDTDVSPYGAAVDYRNLALAIDVQPHQIAMCVNPDDDAQDLPTVDLSCEADGYAEPVSGEDARAYTGVSLLTEPTFIFSAGEPSTSVSRLAQLFGRIYGVVQYRDGYDGVSSTWPISAGTYASFEEQDFFTEYNFESPTFDSSYSDWIWDTRSTRADAEEYVPKVISVGDCQGTECDEGREGTFSVNEVDEGVVEGGGNKRVTASFFTYADSNQMPIRRIVVDWGDDFTSLNGELPWPTGSSSGSTAIDNFYKNHRGLNEISHTEECRPDATEFGKTPQACSSSYIAFSHDYICTNARLSQLQSAAGRECEFADDGRLLNSPCYQGESCVFQPRVHVMDNWGWCTGFCDSGDDGTDGCYSGSVDGLIQDECNIEFCPSEGNSDSCADSSTTTVNPWVNFDGYISITAQ